MAGEDTFLLTSCWCNRTSKLFTNFNTVDAAIPIKSTTLCHGECDANLTHRMWSCNLHRILIAMSDSNTCIAT